MGNKILNISEVSKQYGKTQALDKVSLSIQPGMFGLLGPNGAGKTTLMRIITTVISASAGAVTYNDLNWKQRDQVRNYIGYLPQRFSMYKHILVREALLHIGTLKGVEKKLLAQQVEQVLEKVNLIEHQKKKVHQLSGGMVRRLGIAQAILGDPAIIVVDEPTAGLDPEERIRFRNLLRGIGQNAIVIISTHIVEDIASSCKEVAILNRGQVLQQGEISEIAKAAQGKVWELEASQEEYYALNEKYEVTTTQHIGQSYRVRILADEQPSRAVAVAPSLEDGYLYLMRQVK